MLAVETYGTSAHNAADRASTGARMRAAAYAGHASTTARAATDAPAVDTRHPASSFTTS